MTELSPPALKIAKSNPSKDSGVVSKTALEVPKALISLPADLEDASSFKSPTGKSLFSSKEIISWPTAPVAPTIPMRYFFKWIELNVINFV